MLLKLGGHVLTNDRNAYLTYHQGSLSNSVPPADWRPRFTVTAQHQEQSNFQNRNRKRANFLLWEDIRTQPLK